MQQGKPCILDGAQLSQQQSKEASAVLRAQNSAEQSRSVLPKHHQVLYATKQSLAGFEENPLADTSHRLDSLLTVSVIWSSQLNVA